LLLAALVLVPLGLRLVTPTGVPVADRLIRIATWVQLLGAVARASDSVLARAACMGVIAGVPAVALGIAFSPWLEWLAALALAIASGFVAILKIRLACQFRSSTARACLMLSGTSLIFGMVLASGYAFAKFWGLAWLSILQMLPTHGAINALGFALLGLIGWNLAKARSDLAVRGESADATYRATAAGDARHGPAVRRVQSAHAPARSPL
jgi:hypothetical protein